MVIVDYQSYKQIHHTQLCTFMNVPDEDSFFVIDSLLAYNSHPCRKHVPIFHTFIKSTNLWISILFWNVRFDSGSFWKGLLTFHYLFILFGSTKLVLVIMSIIFRDPFFDNFDDLLVSTFPKQHDLDSWFNDGIRRDVITPFSGFGRMYSVQWIWSNGYEREREGV